MTMNVRDLIPWNRGREVTVRRGEETYPRLTLHREMNRLFDKVFRGFDLTSFGSERVLTWPSIEVSETGKEVKVRAELPGLEEQDVEVQLSNGVLTIQGEKKTEIEDKDRQFSECYYGRFERRIPVDDVDEDKDTASFSKATLRARSPKPPKHRQKPNTSLSNGRKTLL